MSDSKVVSINKDCDVVVCESCAIAPVGKELKFPVMEIFDSIQGEGSMIGMPVTFIRFAGCNLACPWCDTKESWKKPCSHENIDYDSCVEMRSSDMHCKDCNAHGTREQLENRTVVAPEAKYKWMSIAEIVEACNKRVIVMTGGEPCIYELEPLIDALHLDSEKFVCMETNGTLKTPSNIDWVVTSPKPPEYKIHGECFFNELKYVVDTVFTIDCVPQHALDTMAGGIWLQPCDFTGSIVPGFDNSQEATKASVKRCVELAMSNQALRVGIQLHKILDVK